MDPLSNVPAARRRLIQQLAERAQRLRAAAVAGVSRGDFIRQYYRGLGEEDLSETDRDVLTRAALAHLQLAKKRRAGTPLVRIYTPEAARDGWTSPHTVIDIVSEDMPFLVDSIGMALARAQLSVHLLVHPVLKVRRARDGKLLALGEAVGVDESWQHIEVDPLADEAQIEALRERILGALRDVRLAFNDWQAMRRRVLQSAAALADSPPPFPAKEIAEAKAFLEWLADGNFIFLGSQELQLRRGRGEDVLQPVRNTAMGMLRRGGSERLKPTSASGDLRRKLREADLILITKSGSMSTVHRAAYLDQVSIKHVDARGRVIGGVRFVGLFTSVAYNASVRDVPLLRRTVERLVAHFKLAPDSHDAKALLHVVENYPRDELFQTGFGELLPTLRGIVNLYERRRVRVFLRRDYFGRFFSCLLYVPRDRYNSQVRERIERMVLRELQGTEIESQILLSDSKLARLHLLVRVRGDRRIEADAGAIEQKTEQIVRTWSDGLQAALIERFGAGQAQNLLRVYGNAFPAAYQTDVTAEAAVADIADLQAIEASPDGMALRLSQQGRGELHLRVLRRSAPLILSDALPLLENLGLRVLSEQPYRITPPQSKALWVQDFELESVGGPIKDVAIADSLLREVFIAVWNGVVENDRFNRLVLKAGLHWRQVNVLRAYCRYLLQTGVPFSQAYMEQVLFRHSQLAALLYALFAAQFDPALPARKRAQDSRLLQRKILRTLEAVASPDEDRILRGYLAVIEASIRTNHFQTHAQGAPKTDLAIKFSSGQIPHLPLPKPMFEIFVYSPRFEGVHLRSGQVARGGIRWSDRREDFRTEVLGLMKAQTVKNTVIVPVGAKGGFVPKLIPAGATREDIQREGVECYRSFIRGMLDITDNIVGGKIAPPANVVRRDDDDPYLVVAADKGTATFSDIANQIAIEHGFWLGDAFASGGSAGYDHKKMAITARGAWECVKRLFRELGVDVQSQSFTAVGIGDMSGDVFGNGMLLSPHMKLLAAFNHQHIFLDPAPDAATSFAERQRLFALPRSTWEDYDARLISAGGGIFSRSAKTLRISKPVQAMLGIADENLAPQALIQAILRMPVDLLWNGGIGTYVKASGETHASVGDRSNDSVRVDGRELRCKVVGEGGNLGFSQRGRIEYALRGGRMNTDFIDNSGGVDCSDHEVNIKILLTLASKLPIKDRNKLLAKMSEDVAALVLRDNYLQSQAISINETVAARRLPEHAHFIRSLEISRELDRELEFLPSPEEITARHQSGQGLTRPELAVLLSYSKMAFYKRLIATDVAADPYLSQELERYFPPVLRDRYPTLLRQHRLRREIIATATTNSMVNRMGPSFAIRVQEDTGADAAAIARAYTIAREAFEIRDIWQQIEGLDNRVASALQYSMMNETMRLLRFITYWLIRSHSNGLSIERDVAALRPGLRQLHALLPKALTADNREAHAAARDKLAADGVPESLASNIASLRALYAGPDIVELAQEYKKPVVHVAEIYFSLDKALSLDWLRSRITELKVDDRWQALGRSTLRDHVYGLQRMLTARILSQAPKVSASAALDAWLDKNSGVAAGTQQSLNEIRALAAADFATLSVALQSVRRLAEH